MDSERVVGHSENVRQIRNTKFGLQFNFRLILGILLSMFAVSSGARAALCLSTPGWPGDCPCVIIMPTFAPRCFS